MKVFYDYAALIKNIIESDQINEFGDSAYISEEYLEINHLDGDTMNELRLHSDEWTRYVWKLKLYYRTQKAKFVTMFSI